MSIVQLYDEVKLIIRSRRRLFYSKTSKVGCYDFAVLCWAENDVFIWRRLMAPKRKCWNLMTLLPRFGLFIFGFRETAHPKLPKLWQNFSTICITIRGLLLCQKYPASLQRMSDYTKSKTSHAVKGSRGRNQWKEYKWILSTWLQTQIYKRGQLLLDLDALLPSTNVSVAIAFYIRFSTSLLKKCGQYWCRSSCVRDLQTYFSLTMVSMLLCSPKRQPTAYFNGESLSTTWFIIC